jgi:hypothetical protein
MSILARASVNVPTSKLYQLSTVIQCCEFALLSAVNPYSGIEKS